MIVIINFIIMEQIANKSDKIHFKTIETDLRNKKHKSNSKMVTNVRAKLQSMQNMKYDYQDGNLAKMKKAMKGENKLLKLEKSFEKYNNDSNDPQTDQQEIPQDQADQVKIEDRLWHYFLKKANKFDEKVEKEKVNGWKKLVETILRETNKKIQSNQENLFRMDSLIRNKYKQTHEIYKEIESIKLQQFLEAKSATSRRKRTDLDLKSDKIKILQENVSGLKDEIDLQEKEKQIFEQEIKKMEAQKKSLLLNFMQNQYYLHDGMIYVLEHLAEMNHNLGESDFPKILDSRSKFFLIQQYHEIIKKGDHMSHQGSPNKSVALKPSQNKSTLGLLTEKQKLKDIYGSTQEYLSSLVRGGTIRRQQFKLPQIHTNRQHNSSQKVGDNWVQNQRRRIQSAYPEQALGKVKKILFGVKMETILND